MNSEIVKSEEESESEIAGREAEAWLPNLDHMSFARLAIDGEPRVRAMIAARWTGDMFFDMFLDDPSDLVRRKYAANTQTRVSALDKLAGDHDEWVRVAVARNPSTATHTREKLANDESQLVQETVRRYNSGR